MHFRTFVALACLMPTQLLGTPLPPLKPDKMIKATVTNTHWGQKEKPQMLVQRMHADVAGFAVSSDGQFVVTAGYQDRSIRIWNRFGILVRELPAKWAINAIDFSPKGDRITTAGLSGFGIWDLQGKLVASRQHMTPYNHVKYSPSGKHIVMTSDLSFSPDVFVYDKDGKLLKQWKDTAEIIEDVDVSPQNLIATANRHQGLTLWDMKGNKLCMTNPNSSKPYKVAFRPDGELLVTADADHAIRFWSPECGLLHQITSHKKDLQGLAFSSNGKHLLTTAYKEARLWDVSGKLEAILDWLPIAVARDPAFANHDQLIVGYRDTDVLAAWNTEGYHLFDFGFPPKASKTLRFSHDGKTLYAPTWLQLNVWSLNGNLDRRVELPTNDIDGFEVLDDQGNLVSNGDYRGLVFWKPNHSRKQVVERGGQTTALAINSDRSMIAAGNKTGSINLWNNKGEHQKEIKISEHSSKITTLAFSPNDEYLAVGMETPTREGIAVTLWSFSKGEVNQFPGYDAQALAFFADSKHFALVDVVGQLFVGEIGQSKLTSVPFGPVDIEGGAWTLTPSKDQESIFVGAADCTEVVQISPIGKRLKTYSTGRLSTLAQATLSPDGNLLAMLTKDAAIRLLNLKNNALWHMVASKQEWIVFNDDGYFDASFNGGQLAAIGKGLTGFAIDQFALSNNRPDVLLEKMGLGEPKMIEHFKNQYKRRLRRAGVKESQLTRQLVVPNVHITNTEQKDKRLHIQFDVSAPRELKAYNVWVNNVPLFGPHGKHMTGRQAKKKESIELTFGVNKIEIAAMDQAGLESFRAMTIVHFEKPTKPDLYFLGFGVSKYKDSTLNLDYAHKDALDLARMFSNMKGDFGNVHTKTLINAQVTRSNLDLARSFVKKAKVDDTLVIFIAGHGVHDRDADATYYYLTHNADVNSLSNTALPFDDIESLLHNIAPRRKLFLMDTCESGELDLVFGEQSSSQGVAQGVKARAIKRKTDHRSQANAHTGRSYLLEKDRFVYADLLRRSGTIVFSSSRGAEFSFESTQIKNGFFTAEVKQAFENSKADTSKDGVISVSELRSFVGQEVPKKTGNKQHPTVDRDNLFAKFSFPALSTKARKLRQKIHNNEQKERKEQIKLSQSLREQNLASLSKSATLKKEKTHQKTKPTEMVSVDSGSFTMGCSAMDDHCQAPENPGRLVSMSGFLIDKTEVTIAQYYDCVASGHCSKPGTSSTCSDQNDLPKNYPITCVTWEQANDYCRFRGRRLPTEAQWEKAARGEIPEVYPWGDEAPTCDHARASTLGCPAEALPVGSLPKGASPYGVLDMAGNAGEWVADWFGMFYYNDAPTSDPEGPNQGRHRVVRGGGWLSGDYVSLRVSHRLAKPPNYFNPEIGFRCARPEKKVF